MKKRSSIKLYQLLAVIAIAFAGFSCSDSFFDEQAGERITPDQHYKSQYDALVSMEGVIVPLQTVLPKLIMIDGLRSDQMDVNPNADAYLKAINDQIFTADNPFLDASDYYKVIININELLANTEKVYEVDRNFDEYIMHYFKGGLIGMRSWTYLTLLKLYGKAAYIPDNLTALPANLQLNMLSKEALLDTLINQTQPYIYDPDADKRAEVMLSEHFVNSKAVLGELYLEKGDFANAAKYIKMAIESYGNATAMYKVDKTYTKEGWKNIFVGAESGQSENIATVPYNSNESQNNPLPKWLMYDDEFQVKPTQLLVDSFKNQVQLKGLPGDIYRGIGVTIDTSSTGVPYINKYSVDKVEPFSSDIVFSRAADLHLLLAEALNRMGDSQTALIILNAGFNAEKTKPAPYFKWSANLGIRGRAYLMSKVVPDSIMSVTELGDTVKIGFVDYLAKDGKTVQDYVEDLIIEERALELAYEGKRWFDLVRIATRRNDPAYLANRVAAKFAGTAKYDEIRNKLMNPTNWYLPVR